VTRATFTVIFLLAATASASAGCATVRPEQRAVLADPSMQFQGEGDDEQALQHVRDNREGSHGGGTVEGGGCGCN
jgi:hypothetical protein